MANQQVNPAVEKSLKTAARSVKWICLIIAVAVLFSGVTFIQPDEVGLVLRFGQLVGKTPAEQINEPGLKFAFPYLIDDVIRVPVRRIQEVKIDNLFSEGFIIDSANSGYTLTGDDNIVLVEAVAKYQIVAPIPYALEFKDARAILKELVSSSLIQVIANRSVDSILTMEQKELAGEVLLSAQERVDKIGLGVHLVALEFSRIRPPHEVRNEFELVTSAYVQKETMLREANKYREQVIPAAIAESDRMIQQAESRKAERIAAARSDVALFYGLIDEYNNNLSITRVRVYRDRTDAIMERITNKKLLPPGETEATIILPAPQ